MIKCNNISLGVLGENIAANYLSSKGYKILERNFKRRYGEIDIVAQEDNTLVFVEVKTRKGNKFGTPEESITSFKIRNLVSSVDYYKHLHPNLIQAARIDAVAIFITSDNRIGKIKLYKNITG